MIEVSKARLSLELGRADSREKVLEEEEEFLRLKLGEDGETRLCPVSCQRKKKDGRNTIE